MSVNYPASIEQNVIMVEQW